MSFLKRILDGLVGESEEEKASREQAEEKAQRQREYQAEQENAKRDRDKRRAQVLDRVREIPLARWRVVVDNGAIQWDQGQRAEKARAPSFATRWVRSQSGSSDCPSRSSCKPSRKSVPPLGKSPLGRSARSTPASSQVSRMAATA